MSPSLVVLFEDGGYRRLWPLAATRPVWTLRLGGHSLGEKLRAAFHDAKFAYVGRPDVVAAEAEQNGDVPHPRDVPVRGDVLWVNARALVDPSWTQRVLSGKGSMRWLSGRHVLAIVHPAEKLDRVLEVPSLWEEPGSPAPRAFDEDSIEAPFLDEIWDLLRHNHHELVIEGEMALRVAHAAELAPRENPALAPGAHLVSPESVAIHPTARIGPGAVLDGSSGPIVIGPEVLVEPQSYVMGPCWIGAGSHVLGGKLGGGVSLGPVCRIAGEIEETIVQGYSNKRHHGFVGHSVIGSWVNLGALTTTSDLKNNYRPVRVAVEGVECDTGETKIGAFLGDHVKTSIGTLLATGAVIGPATNLFGGGRVTPKSVPAFAWWDGESATPYDPSKFVATAQVVASRRERGFGPAQEALYRTLADRAWSA